MSKTFKRRDKEELRERKAFKKNDRNNAKQILKKFDFYSVKDGQDYDEPEWNSDDR